MLIQGEGSEGSGLWLVREDGSGLVKLRSGLMKYRSAVWSPRGDAIYYLEIRGHVADLVKLPVDPRSGTQRGEPVVLLSGVDGPISISADAKRLLHQQELSWSNLWLVDLEGTEHGESPATKKLTSGTSRVSMPSISPDGKLIAFSMSVGEEDHIFTMPIDGGRPRQLTHATRLNHHPVWSPDGKRIAFSSSDGKELRLSVVDAGGGVPRTFASILMGSDLAWAPGDRILYHKPGNRNYLVFDPESGEEVPLIHNSSVGWIFDATYSPDGDKVAVCWHRYEAELGRKRQSLWVVSVEDSSQFHVSTMDLEPLRWSPDGEWIYARVSRSSPICRIRGTGGAVDTLATLPFDDIGGLSMSTDGKTLVCAVWERQFDIWLIENFDPDAGD
jgi:Tol biopolymer transport system component